MKNKSKTIFIVLSSTIGSFVILIGLIMTLYGFADEAIRAKHTKLLVGTYKLDVDRTKLGNYEKDRNLYRNLELQLNDDASFRFTMEVPFICCTSGKWTAEGSNEGEWNRLIEYKKVARNIEFSQFTPIYKEGIDSIMYLNSTTPQVNHEFIQEIYFVKKSK